MKSCQFTSLWRCRSWSARQRKTNLPRHHWRNNRRKNCSTRTATLARWFLHLQHETFGSMNFMRSPCRSFTTVSCSSTSSRTRRRRDITSFATFSVRITSSAISSLRRASRSSSPRMDAALCASLGTASGLVRRMRSSRFNTQRKSTCAGGTLCRCASGQQSKRRSISWSRKSSPSRESPSRIG